MAISASSSNITKSSNSIEIYQGESRDISLEVLQESKDINGVTIETPVDLTGCVFYFSVRTTAKSPALLISKTSSNMLEIELLTPLTGGKALIHITSDDTKHLDPGEYVFDVWTTLSSGKSVPVVAISSFIVRIAVTKLP